MRRARALLGTYYASMLEYRGELFLWAVAMSLPLVLMGLWVEAAAQAPRSLSPAGFARYFVLAFVLRQMTVVWVIYEFTHQVVSGSLSPLLLQPIDPVWRYIAVHRAETVVRLPLILPLIALVFFIFPEVLTGDETLGPWRPGLLEVGMALVLVELAWWVRFLLQYTVSMLAFFVERVTSLDAVISIPYLFLSGLVAPLEEFPAVVAEVAMLTPFPYMLWMPVMLVLEPGRVAPADFLRGVVTLLAWGFGLFLLNRLAWRRGLARYSAMGA